MAGWLAYLILCAIWGSTWLFIRVGLADMPPLWLLAFRLWPALAFLGILAAVGGVPMRPLLQRKNQVLQVCLLTYPVSYSLVHWAEQHVTSGMAAVMFASMPFFVAVFGWWMLPEERIDRRRVTGLLLGVSGLLVIYWDQIQIQSTSRILGMLAIMVSAAVASWTTVIARRWLAHVPAVALAAATAAGGALIVPLFALAGPPLETADFTGASVGAALYLGVAGSGVTFALYYRLLREMTALTMSLIAFITPLIALALGAVFDYEPFGLRMWAGTAMVLAGVLLTAVKSRRVNPGSRTRAGDGSPQDPGRSPAGPPAY